MIDLDPDAPEAKQIFLASDSHTALRNGPRSWASAPKTIWFAVLEVIATAVPLATPLILALLAAEPVRRVIKTVGATPAVSNMKPAGAFRMMMPVPTFPFAQGQMDDFNVVASLCEPY